MSRILRPCLVLAALLGLTACQAKPVVSASEPSAAPPSQTALWRIEVVDGAAAASPLDICADETVRASFARPSPQVNGQPCLRTKPATTSGQDYGERCRIGNDLFTVRSATKGDRSTDFTVEMAVTPQGHQQPTFQQTRHYRRLGACPSGWRIGEAAAPGAKVLLDTLHGTSRPRPALGD